MKPKTLVQKITVCLLAGLICGETLLRIGDRFLTTIIPLQLVMGLSVLLLVMSIVYSVLWHFKYRERAELISAFWIGAIRYGIAFDLVMFGLQKIFHLQFIAPLAMLDEPFSSFSNEWLTWSYFARSYGFAVVIGLFQIMGSLLLMYNSTRLLGAIVLVPVLVNIIFIDYFYELDAGVQIHALILFAGIIYLLLLDYDRLVEFFLKHKQEETSVRIQGMVLKNAGRLSILVIPVILIAFNESPNKHPQLRGRYDVKGIKINGESKVASNSADSVLTRVYFDVANECVFQFNDVKRRAFGTYELNEQNGEITTTWHFPEKMKLKAFKGKLLRENKTVVLNGILGQDSVLIELNYLGI